MEQFKASYLWGLLGTDDLVFKNGFIKDLDKNSSHESKIYTWKTSKWT